MSQHRWLNQLGTIGSIQMLNLSCRVIHQMMTKTSF
jgi:hypothetical protein